jgi:hypothetical protein
MSTYSELDQVEEFDIQKTVLKSRNTKKEQRVYVEYDKLTSLPVAVSPVEIQPSAKRNSIAVVDASTVTTRLFQNKLSLSKLIIKKNQTTGRLELSENQQRRKGEFDFIFATAAEKSFIHLQCDVVTKKILVIFDYNIFKLNMLLEKTLEKNLEELPDYVEIYCIDKNERSRLFGKINIPTKELFEQHSICFKCDWLPDDTDSLKNIGFLYYNDNQIISYDYQNTEELVAENNFDYRPNLLYKQVGNVLKLQSTIQDINSFRLNDLVELYICHKYDPTKMMGSVKFSSAELNNYNNFEIKLSSNKEVKLVCNYFHLHAKEEDASTDYQF